MAVKIAHLQLIYGVAGAREKFEDLIVQLIRSECPDVDRVRIVRGDGGVDAYSGKLADPAGVDVFQMKFFPDGIGDSQKGQIRESFKTVKETSKFTLRSWTLCIPLDMDTDEKLWFDKWAAKQTGVVINPVWSAAKLEGLLYEPKNRGVKEEFFKEEHLQQIRESHVLIRQLLEELDERIPRRSPLVLDSEFQRVAAGNSYVMNEQWAVVEVVCYFSITNNNASVVSSWAVRPAFEVRDAARFVTKREFEPLRAEPYFHGLSMAILPTVSKEHGCILGLKIDRTQPLLPQLSRYLDPIIFKYELISDNHVAEQRIINAGRLIVVSEFYTQASESLRKAGVTFVE
jgi:hypothetical protein